jgi:hypothetical protein
MLYSFKKASGCTVRQLERSKMLRSEYCLARAEHLRMLMLTASDPASAVRLRGFIEKYRVLAERSKKLEERTQKQVESPPLNPVGIKYGLSYAPRNTNSPTHWQGGVDKMRVGAHSRERGH